MADRLGWPREGRCGACGREAIEFPSGNWAHKGVPCRARSQAIWRIDDVAIRNAVRFVPVGEPLPTDPEELHWHPTGPQSFALCTADHSHSVREFLAAEAESREACRE